MNQKGRSDLPECRADATFLFDDAYKNSTRGEKKQADARQYGRSMVEMLGVLAIIGVLSVGGIAGYSRAMEKYKINKTVNEISHIVMNAREFYKNEKDYIGLGLQGNNTDWSTVDIDLLKKSNIFPEHMWDGDELINSFKGKVIIGYEDHRTFYISYGGLSESVCKTLAIMNWQEDLGFQGVGACFRNCDAGSLNDCGDDSIIDASTTYNGEVYVCKRSAPMNLETADIGCQCPDGSCSIILLYK